MESKRTLNSEPKWGKAKYAESCPLRSCFCEFFIWVAFGDLTPVSGSSGIGAALARRFARAGHDLVLVARSRAKLKALAAELEKRHQVTVLVQVADLARPGAATKLAAKLKRRRLAVGILVNNAGVNATGEFHKLTTAENLDIVALNVAAATEMLSAFVPPMVKRGHGRVLNVASTSSFLPVPYMATITVSIACRHPVGLPESFGFGWTRRPVATS